MTQPSLRSSMSGHTFDSSSAGAGGVGMAASGSANTSRMTALSAAGKGADASASAGGARQPAPRSTYYFGPPSANAAFGTAPAGVIGRDKPREVLRVERDYSGGELCQFHPTFPLELEGRISPTLFAETINDINVILIDANSSAWACFDNALASLTLYISPLLIGSKYKREMAKLDAYINRTNKEVFNPAGLNIVHPRHSAFLFMEIEYY